MYDAVDDYQRRLGVAVGRGGYAAANEVAELVEAARQKIADLTRFTHELRTVRCG